MEGAEFFITRHTKKPKGVESVAKEYPGVSEEGVELAKKRVVDIISWVESLPNGSIIALLGISPMERTRSTMKIYAESLRESLKDKKGFILVTRDEIKNLYKEEKGVHKTIEAIRKKIEENQTAKVIIEFPLVIKEFSDPKWFNPEDKDKTLDERRLSPYIDHLGGIKRFREQRDQAIKQWFDEKGMVNNEQLGPNPKEIAEGHLRALYRLWNFTRKIFPDKPLNIVIVGHSLEMDAFFTFLANEGQINSRGFEKIGGLEFQETEPAKIKLNEDGTIELNYRGKSFIYKPEETNEKK